MGGTQLDPGTKLNLDLPLSLEWEVLQHEQFMTNAAAIAEDNMLGSTVLQSRVTFVTFPMLFV